MSDNHEEVSEQQVGLDFGAQQTWSPISVLPLGCHVTSSRLLNLSELQFP